jgi:lysozyme
MINARGLAIINKYATKNTLPAHDAEALIDNFVTVPLLDNQRAALVSFAASVGLHKFYNSKLLKYVNERQFHLAAAQFAFWVRQGGKRRSALVRRRAAERALFLRPEIVSGG